LANLVLKCTVNPSADLTAQACIQALDNALTKIKMLDFRLNHALQNLKDQLPDPAQSRKKFQAWWQTNHSDWLKQLKVIIAEYHTTQQDWHFSPEQQERLQRYYDANQLLLDCLNSNCAVTAAVRQEIEAALLLPQKELEERQWSTLNSQ
jgi:predicted NACHT family NTPase